MTNENLELRVLMVREMIVETLRMIDEAGLEDAEKAALVGILAGRKGGASWRKQNSGVKMAG